MAGRSVFECDQCGCRYDQVERVPLSLPCGHVFCRVCLRMTSAGERIKCPIDKVWHSTALDKLPCCLPLLGTPPKTQPQYARCSEHPHKRVRFHCKDHSAYLCANCIIKHTGEGHQIVAFEVTLEEMRREAESVYLQAQKLVAEVRECEGGKSAWERKVAAYSQSQVAKVTAAFDSAIHKLTIKKADLIDRLKYFHKNQQTMLETKHSSTVKRRESSQSILEELQRLRDNIEEKSYDEFLRIMNENRNKLRTLESTGDSGAQCSLYAFREGAMLGDFGSIVEAAWDEIEDSRNPVTAPTTPLTRGYDVSSNSPQSGSSVDEPWKCKDCGALNGSALSLCYRCRTLRDGSQSARKLSDSSAKGKDTRP